VEAADRGEYRQAAAAAFINARPPLPAALVLSRGGGGLGTLTRLSLNLHRLKL